MKLATVLTLLASIGCGPEAVLWLRVEAPLKVGRDCDALQVEVSHEDKSVLDRRFDLSQGPEFPLTISLTTSDFPTANNGRVVVRSSARKGEALAQPWSQTQGEATLQRRVVTELVLRMCDCNHE